LQEARERLLAGAPALWAPHLVDAEVGHVLRRAVMGGKLRASSARAALQDLSVMPLRRVPHRSLLERAWELRHNVSFYDGLYIALAELLEMPLITTDAKLCSASGVRSEIEVLA
jgi:predicted nucleic acid-binding protein